MSVRSTTLAQMSPRELLDTMQADTPLTRVQRAFSAGYAEIEQAALQGTPIIELRRMELQAANRILDLFGISLP